jgi:hypothetical protein
MITYKVCYDKQKPGVCQKNNCEGKDRPNGDNNWIPAPLGTSFAGMTGFRQPAIPNPIKDIGMRLPPCRIGRPALKGFTHRDNAVFEFCFFRLVD